MLRPFLVRSSRKYLAFSRSFWRLSGSFLMISRLARFAAITDGGRAVE